MNIEQNIPDMGSMRNALGTFSASVNVITTQSELGVPTGMTATAFSSVSFDPPSVLIGVNQDTRTNYLIKLHGKFGVNILNTEDVYKSNYFASRGQNKDIQEEWLDQNNSWQSPCLKTAMAFFDCEVKKQIDFGTHTIFIAEVLNIGLPQEHAAEDNPLIHFKGEYRMLKEKVRGLSQLPLPVVADFEYSTEVYI